MSGVQVAVNAMSVTPSPSKSAATASPVESAGIPILRGEVHIVIYNLTGYSTMAIAENHDDLIIATSRGSTRNANRNVRIAVMIEISSRDPATRNGWC